jgi:hypothetical protein
MRALLLTAFTAVTIALGATAVSAQTPPGAPIDPAVANGWIFTPAFGYSSVYDDNPLVAGQEADQQQDMTLVFSPSGSLAYNGRRGFVSASYAGGLLHYRQFSGLDSYEENAYASARRLITHHTTLTSNFSFSQVPTTEAQMLVGVPFVRVGARLAQFGGGVDHMLAKHTTLSGSYMFQIVDFDQDPITGQVLFGGHGQTASTRLEHALSERLSIDASYDIQQAMVVASSPFHTQNLLGGVTWDLSEATTVFGAFGLASHNAADDPAVDRRTPTWRMGASRHFDSSVAQVTYSRSFMPSFGIDAPIRADDVSTSLQVPLGQRLMATGSWVWHTDQSVLDTSQTLTSHWLTATLGYAIQRWIRVEGFYAGTHQTLDRPGGTVNRNRLGFQISTSKPLRMH